MDDPIHFLVRKYGWCGVLLEPDPQLFERLKENYSGVDGPILVNAALSPINGKTTFYRIRVDEKMPNCARYSEASVAKSSFPTKTTYQKSKPISLRTESNPFPSIH